MLHKKFYAFLTALSLLALAVFGGGGCGGSSSSGGGSSSRNAVYLGTKSGELYDALLSKLKFRTADVSVAANSATDSLSEGDIAIFGPGYWSDVTDEKTALAKDLYGRNVTLVLLDADNAQINALRNALDLADDSSLPSKEEWEEMVKNGGYQTEGEWTGTQALYALARREDAESWTGENVMTNVIPNSSNFAYKTSGDVHYDNYIDENGNPIDKEEIEKWEKEFEEMGEAFQAVKLKLWNKIMTDCGFTEGTAGTKDMLEDDGSTTHVTYNGSDTIEAVGTQNGQDVSMTLTKGSDGKISFTVSDNFIQDMVDNTEPYDAEAENAKYNESRVEGFIEWNDALDELTVSMAADKREIRAAADSNELNLDNLKGESRTWHCSPPAKQKKLTMHNPPAIDDRTVTITVKRSHTITINNYAIHNFSDGSDWYIVRFGGTLNPSGQYKRQERTGMWDYVWGHTGYYELGALLDNGASGTVMYDSAPKNANKEQTKSVGLSMNLSGKIGLSDKGPSGEIGGGITSTKSTSWTTSDYETYNGSSGTWAGIRYIFAHPTKGSKGNGIGGDGLEDAVVTSRAAFNPNVQAVWRVDKSYWQKNGLQRKIKADLSWADSIARGNICYWYVTIYGEAQEDYPEAAAPYTFTPQPPMHFALGKKNVAVNKEAQTYAFTILSEGNWSTEMSAETAKWCSLSETSGTATNGDNERQMMLTMTENDTGKIRRGEIKFKLNSNGLKETHTLTVEQAPTSKIIN